MLSPSQTVALEEYVRIGNRDTPGWLWQSAAYLTAILGLKQIEDGVLGNLGEIGIWQGRYLYLLGLLSRPDEKVVGIDSFIHSPDPIGFAQQINNRFDLEPATQGKLKLLKKNSTKLTPRKIKKIIPGSYRLFSVDGGHLAHEVLSDCNLVSPMMVPGGIMILDDFSNHTCPGVFEGTLEFLKSRQGRNFAAFCLVGNKLMVTDKASAETYRRYLLDIILENTDIPIFRDSAKTIADFPEGVYPKLCGSDLIVITWSGDFLIADNHGVPVLIRTKVCDMQEIDSPEVQLPPVGPIVERSVAVAG